MSDNTVHPFATAELYAGMVARSRIALAGGTKPGEVMTDLCAIAGMLRAELELLTKSIAKHGHVIEVARSVHGRPRPPTANPAVAARSTVLQDYLRVLAALELADRP